jgi:hypothetical protein
MFVTVSRSHPQPRRQAISELLYELKVKFPPSYLSFDDRLNGAELHFYDRRV